MEFISTKTSDGFELTGLYSRASAPTAVLVHVHGYGGDFYSHTFVKLMHQSLPRHGVSFLSFGMRTTGYIGEQYTDVGVQYVGSSLVDQHAALADIEAVARAVGEDAPLVLQGHSFGTNLVRTYALTHPGVSRAVFLNPSDSAALQAAYVLHSGQASTAPVVEGDELRWDLFGIVSGGRSYAIPITSGVFAQLVCGAEFNAWSSGGASLGIPCLVVQGEDDAISLYGNTSSKQSLSDLLPNASFVVVPGARHTFEGHEAALCSHLVRWLRETT